MSLGLHKKRSVNGLPLPSSSNLHRASVLREPSMLESISPVQYYDDHNKENNLSLVKDPSFSVLHNPLSSLNNVTSLSGSLDRESRQSVSSLSQDILISKIRKINSQPYRVMDAPNLIDDFYLNLVDWSLQNIIAVALG
jgi:hypothetical protein